jgi:hypothetical protein
MSKQSNVCNLTVCVVVGFLTIHSVSKMKLSSNGSNPEDTFPHSITFISRGTSLFIYKLSPCVYSVLLPRRKNFI